MSLFKRENIETKYYEYSRYHYKIYLKWYIIHKKYKKVVIL